MDFSSGEIQLGPQNQWAAILHGGAAASDPRGEKIASAMTEIKKIASQLTTEPFSQIPFLNVSTLALRIALKAVNLLEAHPGFNAGFGASLQADGVARVSASVMESSKRRFSAVINGEQIKHPSQLAVYLQDQRYSVLDPQGTRQLAEKLQVPLEDLVTDERRTRWLNMNAENQSGKTGTVGCVSFDLESGMAVITSTGGVGNEVIGRVGDSPTIAGNFCGEKAAASFTGTGEQIIALGGAARLVSSAEAGGDLIMASKLFLEDARSRNFEIAFIALMHTSHNKLQWVAARTTPSMIWTLT